MKQYGLLGEHLSHSYSKIIHNLIFKHLGIEATYQLVECSEDELKEYIQALKEGIYSGFNVTIPFKKTILPFLDEVDEKAKKIGSVNTIYLKNGKVIGTNTDYDGFLGTIQNYHVEVFQKNCYILGTGGASLAIEQVLKDLGGTCIKVSRTPSENQISYYELEEKEIDLLVNTTPVGMYPNVLESPVSSTVARKAKTVIDIIFNPKRTKLLEEASSSINGLYMLVLQAMRAEEIWQGRTINISEDELLNEVEFILELPNEITEIIRDLPFRKDKTGCSGDEVYLFQDQYVLKVSRNYLQLRREKEKMDWLSNILPCSNSVAYIEKESKGYYLRTCIKGDSLIAPRFLKNPMLLIETIKKVVKVLRELDYKNCPFHSTDNCGKFFVHGDLCLPNIFVDEQNNFCGFIDLNNAGLGDLYYDYVWLLWSFEYNMKTNQYNERLLKELDIKIDEAIYRKYIPKEYMKMLTQYKE